ncbi:PREDICTED: WD repeat-containing protein 90 isoform X4 [Cercocebus atys]|uniref:WD repeat-containing protein 90 isoform X4 n=1 Tax=Cercocebus atys TaxID=9531 RepID=UPI0005F550F6|nr:PREDICTED: WD repeat-containing protein 90 isoform X4 [Cercocebus atys]
MTAEVMAEVAPLSGSRCQAPRCMSRAGRADAKAGSSSGAMARAWQHPFLNVFRHFRVDEWKRSAKQGDVAVVTDKTLKGAVYRIRGSVSAANYIQLPKNSTQSLGLTGRYLYVLFRPLPNKHFVIHLDVSTEDNQVIRVSFSNLFKEFKSTATRLQFPFVLEARTPQRDLVGLVPHGARWTFLQLDLQDILLVHLNRRYGHLKSVRLCASLLVRNLYTSDLCFEPAISGAPWAKLPVTSMPREMAFPVPKGESWHDRYVHVRFPSDSLKVPSKPIEKSGSPPEAVLLGPGPRPLPCPVACSKPVRFSVSPVVQTPRPTAAPLAPRPFPEVSLSQECSEASNADGPGFHSLEPWARVKASDVHTAAAGPHVLTHESTEVPVALEDAGSCKRFLPDPILRLKGVIGFGGHSTRQALWTPDGTAVVYPCHAVIVVLLVDTGEQRFFLGHTDKVSALALDGSGSLLASAQARTPSVIRLWDFQTGRCLCVFQSPVHVVCSLSFSDSGALLCGVGKDRHGRTMVVAWGTGQVGLGGEVVVLAKAHTDFDVQAFRVTFFDETRMASCGQGSVRLWRLRGGALRSCPVDLGEHHVLQFTDLAFKQAQDGCPKPSAAMLFVCSRSGHILEIDCQCMVVRHARRLLPTQTPGGPHPQKQTFSTGPGIAISSLSLSPAMCAVGSADGYLRLWPLDFSSVLLEAEHEGPVSSVCVSPDGLRVLSATSSGHLGFLDTPSRVYHMLARSHTAPVLALATEQRRGQLATVSQDRTVRIWDLATLQQLYDFTSLEEAPCTVTFHPTRPIFFCGFSSGAVRSFSLEAAEVLVEHTCHQGAITGLTATPDGRLLFSSCSRGSLAQYNCADPQWHVLRVAADMVWPDAPATPSTLAVSRDGRLLAFVGPSRHTVTVMGSASLDEPWATCWCPPRPTESWCWMLRQAASSGSEDTRFLLMAAGRAVKVWDYRTQASPGPQVYIGHSEPVQAVTFSPDQQQVLSAGDAVFLWDILATTESNQSFPGPSPACEAGLGTGQLEDAASRASELPRQQVPKPSQASPPRQGICARPPEGGDGTFTTSDEEGPCEESRDPEGSLLTEKEAGRAGDGAWAAAVGSWGLALSPRSPSQPCEQWRAGQGRWCRCRDLRAVGTSDTKNSGAPCTTCPTSHKAFTPARASRGPHSAKVMLWPSGTCLLKAPSSRTPAPALRRPPDGTLWWPPADPPSPLIQQVPLRAPRACVPPGPGTPSAHTSHPCFPIYAPGCPLQLAWVCPKAASHVQALGPRWPCWAPAASRSPSLQGTSLPPASSEWLRLKAVVGYSGNGRANMVWRPDTGPAPARPRPQAPPSLRTGFFAYTCGRLVVVEDLHSGAQQHWPGHPAEISTLALSHSAQVLASASGRSSTTDHCQIRVWDVSGGLCQHLISHHSTTVLALAFSPDDRLLVTLGDHDGRTLALWDTATYDLVSSTRLPEPVHGVAFNPWDAGELTCVGQGTVTFWLLQQCGADISLQVHREQVPETVGAGELTSLCYGAPPLLYCGTSSGQVCVWDTCAGHCFLSWEADDGGIGLLLCSSSRLVSGSSTGRLRLWAVGPVSELRCKGSGARSSSVFMERELVLDGAVVSASFDDSVDMGVVGTRTGTLWFISWAEGTSTRLISGQRSKVNEVVFGPGESHCATCGEDGSVRVWALASMELVIQFQVLNQSCLCLAWSPRCCGRPEQQRLAAGYGDGSLRIFSVSRTAMELKMRPHPVALTTVTFSTDGQTVLSGDKDGLVAVSHSRTGMTFRVLSDHQGAPISTICVTRKECEDLGVEGTDLWLAASGDQRVSVWASDWLRNRCELVDWLSFPMPATTETQGHLPPSLAAFCPWDGALLMYVGPGVDKEVIIYDLSQKQVVEKIPLPFFAMSLSLSPGTRLLALGFAECMLRLVDYATGTAQDFAGHNNAVHLCRFTPSARLLFTAACNEILVWEVSGR